MVTGAGRGLGRATALQCAHEGADLVVAFGGSARGSFFRLQVATPAVALNVSGVWRSIDGG